ncbi:MAG TPA: intradiol ring-cleavage dioxygenase [Xanthobacteraceae bacterium]|nr:intradiol ring-cleavage dioxygenase [Xanthobacteraceae bacterium]
MTERMPSRRQLLFFGALVASGFAAGDAFGEGELAPTPECRDGDEPTPRLTEGPFYKPRSPRRSDLTLGVKGRVIELAGLVLTRRCNPVARAIVDLWHADDKGEYDHRGFRLRGHQLTDAGGRYRFRTVVPAVYTGRTRHFHVKVAAPERPVLTTQLYFPDEPGNAQDFLFRRELLMRVSEAGDGLAARFDFVVDMS